MGLSYQTLNTNTKSFKFAGTGTYILLQIPIAVVHMYAGHWLANVVLTLLAPSDTPYTFYTFCSLCVCLCGSWFQFQGCDMQAVTWSESFHNREPGAIERDFL